MTFPVYAMQRGRRPWSDPLTLMEKLVVQHLHNDCSNLELTKLGKVADVSKFVRQETQKKTKVTGR